MTETYDYEPEIDLDEILSFHPVDLLSKDIRDSAETLGERRARYLVDTYYAQQKIRKALQNQFQARASEQPHQIFTWTLTQQKRLEKQVAVALQAYVESQPIGQWLLSIRGIGPIIAAGLMTNLYMGIWCAHCHGRSAEECALRQKKSPHVWQPIESCPTVSHFWAYAGIAGSGQKKWEKGKLRPWNAQLKQICWNAAEVFKKMNNDPTCFYGQMYKKRKQYEVEMNESGKLKEEAARALREKNYAKDKTTVAYKCYIKGKLPPAHLDSRAMRWTIKLLLAHLHNELYRQVFNKEAPAPYPIAFLGHAHVIPAPVAPKQKAA